MLFLFCERVAPVKLTRVVHGKPVLDWKEKLQAVEREYWAWQRQLQGLGGEQLYSDEAIEGLLYRQGSVLPQLVPSGLGVPPSSESTTLL
jgi:hypothetical protein